MDRPFLGHHYYALSLYEPCPRVEKISKEMMHFQYTTYIAMPYHKNPCPRGHEIYNLSGTFLGYHYHSDTLSLSE